MTHQSRGLRQLARTIFDYFIGRHDNTNRVDNTTLRDDMHQGSSSELRESLWYINKKDSSADALPCLRESEHLKQGPQSSFKRACLKHVEQTARVLWGAPLIVSQLGFKWTL